MNESLLFCDNPAFASAYFAERKYDCVSLPFISAVGFYDGISGAAIFGRSVAVAAVKTTQFKKADGADVKPYLTENNGAKGIGVAVIDTGCAAHLDFCFPTNRLKSFEVTDKKVKACVPRDVNGHGTHVVGVIAGNGVACAYKTAGIAKNCNIISIKAVDDNGQGSAINILIAMQWIFDNRDRYNIKVLNLSLGTESGKGVDPLNLGAEALASVGITVVASAGNDGPQKATLKSPAVSRRVLTVGGAKKFDFGWYAAEFSSRGKDGSFKPDVIAPSVNVISTDNSGGYSPLTGTSVAAPIVSGMCAVIISAHPQYTPDKVKEIIMSKATRLDCAREVCGVGLVGESVPDA